MRIEMKELRRLKRLARAKERDEAKQSEQKEDPGEEPERRREPEPIPDSEIREPPAAPMIDDHISRHRRNSSTDSTATIQRPPRPFPNMFD